jgi:hypothetical protein
MPGHPTQQLGSRNPQLWRRLPATQLRFSQLRVTERAIFALTPEPCATITRLRYELSELLRDPDVLRPRHDIVHTTLARFAAPAQLGPDDVRAIESLPNEFDVPLTSVRIVRELVYPSLMIEEMQRFTLG